MGKAGEGSISLLDPVSGKLIRSKSDSNGAFMTRNTKSRVAPLESFFAGKFKRSKGAVSFRSASSGKKSIYLSHNRINKKAVKVYITRITSADKLRRASWYPMAAKCP